MDKEGIRRILVELEAEENVQWVCLDPSFLPRQGSGTNARAAPKSGSYSCEVRFKGSEDAVENQTPILEALSV